MIIAIDGPAASGKSTLAKRIAAALGVPHLNTGLLYRAVARDVLNAGQPLTPGDGLAAARRLDMASLGDAALSDLHFAEAASVVAAFPEVRAALLGAQHEFIAQARRERGAVIEGRDIGTVVCPDAERKLFVTASLETRASRRFVEMQQKGVEANEAAICEDLRKRDERDASRASAPLAMAGDAYLLDTTKLDIEAAVNVALAYIHMAQARSS
jgi:cytidylate kinase